MVAASATAAIQELDVTEVGAGDTLRVATRFGTYAVDAKKLVTMPRGPHGFANLRRYALLEIPGAESGNMKLFQAVDDPSVGFVVLPLAQDGGLIARADLDEACRQVGTDPADTAFLLLLTVRVVGDGTPAMTANLRAPLVLDTARRQARQHIFAQSGYDTRHPL